MIYIYKVDTLEIVNTYKTSKEFERSLYAQWGEGDWNGSGLAACRGSSAAFGCYDGLKFKEAAH